MIFLSGTGVYSQPGEMGQVQSQRPTTVGVLPAGEERVVRQRSRGEVFVYVRYPEEVVRGENFSHWHFRTLLGELQKVSLPRSCYKAPQLCYNLVSRSQTVFGGKNGLDN